MCIVLQEKLTMKFKIEILGVIVSFFGILFYSNVFSQNSKTILSEKWKFRNYDSPVFFKTKSKTDNLRNVYVVGSTLNSQNNRDLIIQKLDPAGNLKSVTGKQKVKLSK